MIITQKAWTDYIAKLRKLSDAAANELTDYMNVNKMLIGSHLNPNLPQDALQDLIDHAFALATKYGEGAGTMACEMYDAIATLSGVAVPAAVPAETATYGDIAKAIHGTILQTTDAETIAGAVGRQVKLVGVDTMMHNALRDGAEWAWIPQGETCAFCLMLASNGWQKASKKALRHGHAQHIHANCDCTYCIRFSDDLDVAGYDPDKYRDMYYDAGGDVNAMRRDFYAENREAINAQKRSAYAKSKALEASTAEEHNVN